MSALPQTGPDAFAPVLELLRAAGLAGANEHPRAVPLAGGVSSDIWKVDLAQGPVCVKRALPRLRVAQLWEAPVERNRYERMWMEAVGAILPGATPRVLAHDNTGLFAMEYLPPERYPLWKAELAAGHADRSHASTVGERLARIHAATAGNSSVAERFATDASFRAIRLEPYLIAAARRHPALAARLHALAERTAATRHCLVHGDVSPKNLLIGPQGPVFLDAECAWYGDPAFDAAFCLNHLLLKCLWVPTARDAFIACFDAFSASYLAGAHWESRAALEARVASLLPGLLLARVDGKSPVEYLTGESDQARVRRVASALIEAHPSTLGQVRDAWLRS